MYVTHKIPPAAWLLARHWSVLKLVSLRLRLSVVTVLHVPVLEIFLKVRNCKNDLRQYAVRLYETRSLLVPR